MTTKHTLEPWLVEQRTRAGEFVTETHIVSKDGSHIALVSPCAIEANAARIVACVNGCAGINPEAVRDLLAALEFYADAARYHEQDGWLAQDLGEKARAAIDKAWEGQ